MAREDSFDLINLDGPLTVEAILKTLQQRFMDGHCYTWIGPVLLCINPFETLGQAMDTVLKQLTERALQDISSDRQPRAILFNGVSGSGKSFTADQLLVRMFQNTQRTDWLQEIRKYWQVSTVVLKALGTACTEENKDSSRIGRIVDLTMNGQKITKVKMNCFFLDQTRMVNPNPTEQNYHILYQMLAGLSPEERSKFMLNYHDVRTLHYLSQGTEPKESVPQLQSHFEAWKSSLAQLGIPLMDVLKVLAAVMLLGNTLFYEAKNQELSLQGTDELRSVATLLGVQPLLLQRGLTLRTYRSGRGQVVHSPCSAAAANGARDALAKALYIRTVVAIMRRINTLLRGASQKMQGSVGSRHSPSAEETTLHVVDMFGFENCETNSLEQLCINWTAEKLHHYFTQSLFTATIKECQEEGVDPMFESVLYDCSPCLELVGGQSNGMLEMLNEETLSPRVSSEDIRIRLREKFKSNDRFIPPTGSSSTFAIRHYCGTVIYDTYSLLNANADTLADDVVATFNSKDCKFGFVAHLFAVELNRDLLADGTPRGQMCRITPAYLQHVSSPDSKQPTTYVQDFQSNVLESFNNIKKAKPYYIQCMKSNSNQMAGHFDKEVVGQQIQHMAIFETVDFMQCAYTHWMTFEDFILRYSLLSPDVVRSKHRRKANETVERLYDMSCVTAGTCMALGKSKGHIQLILGPMFSGKTTELVRRMKRFQVANHSCLLIKYAKDKRYDKGGVATHDKQVTSAMATTELAAMKNTARKYGVIGIDEGQFFPDIVEFCEEMANDGKMVIVAALDGTFQRKPFGPILDLVPLAESVIKLKAVCMVCFNDAAFTKRLGMETEVEVIGGADKYMAVCRSCYKMPDKSRLTSTYSSPSPSEKTPIRGAELTMGRHLHFDDH